MDEDEQLEAHQREQDVLLANALRELKQLQALMATYDEMIEAAKAKICGMLDERGEKSASTELDGAVYKVTVVAGERVKVDESGLKSALGARTWNKLTVRKVSPDLLREAIAAGTVNGLIAREFIEIKPNKVFPKVTMIAKVGE